MTPVARTRTLAPVIALTRVFLTAAAPARADITAFIGLSPTPENHSVRGFGAGVSLLIVGFEFEHANLSKTMPNNCLGSRRIRATCWCRHRPSTQLYATIGAGGYQESLGPLQETHVGEQHRRRRRRSIVGLGPIRVRADYRVFQLRGEPMHSTYQRVYVGGNLTF